MGGSRAGDASARDGCEVDSDWVSNVELGCPRPLLPEWLKQRKLLKREDEHNYSLPEAKDTREIRPGHMRK